MTGSHRTLANGYHNIKESTCHIVFGLRLTPREQVQKLKIIMSSLMDAVWYCALNARASRPGLAVRSRLSKTCPYSPPSQSRKGAGCGHVTIKSWHCKNQCPLTIMKITIVTRFSFEMFRGSGYKRARRGSFAFSP